MCCFLVIMIARKTCTRRPDLPHPRTLEGKDSLNTRKSGNGKGQTKTKRKSLQGKNHHQLVVLFKATHLGGIKNTKKERTQKTHQRKKKTLQKDLLQKIQSFFLAKPAPFCRSLVAWPFVFLLRRRGILPEIWELQPRSPLVTAMCLEEETEQTLGCS